MKMTAKDIAALVGGTVEGDPDVEITRPGKIEEGGEGVLTFLANPKYEPWIYKTTAAAVLVSNDFQPKEPVGATLIRVPNVQAAVAQLLEQFAGGVQHPTGIASSAEIHAEADIGERVGIGDFVVVARGASIGDGCVLYPHVYVGENVHIGPNTVLYPGVKVYRETVIGSRCVVHANTVIGSDGFGFAPQPDGSWKKVPQTGRVRIEDDVEIGANTVIDRATMGETVIRQGAKIDNLVQIAHNVEVGAHTVIAAQAGIAGSTKLGKGCQIGGQAGFVGHIRVADGTRVQAQSGVARPVTEPGQALQGSPAFGYMDYNKAYAVFKKLPDLYRKIHELEKQLKKALEKNTED